MLSSMDNLMTPLNNHSNILKQSTERRMEESGRQLAAMQQMHRERMDIKEAFICNHKQQFPLQVFFLEVGC